jgi:inosine-uridine nucleoside N-ribohydrolase
MTTTTKIPVILDTDIGSDIDDAWALAMLLRCPELDLKLVTSATSDTTARARIIAKMLALAGRDDVPVGVGAPMVYQEMPYADWAKDFDLAAYRGGVHKDGVQALIDAIMKSARPVTLICIGPLTNIAEALRREPRIAQNSRFVGMTGSVYRGFDRSPEIITEWNVKCDIPACQATFAAPWDMTITPVDTCSLVRLTGEKYAACRRSPDVLTLAVIEQYDMWRRGRDDEGASSILFDTVAVYLAFSEELLSMKTVGVRVTDDGFTPPDASARPVHVAADWKDLPAFEDFLVKRLTGKPCP